MNKDYILKIKPKVRGVSTPEKAGSPGGGGGRGSAAGWKVRPGGMFVQKRISDSNQSFNSVPNIKVTVKYGSSYNDVIISSEASFGHLKELLAGPTRLHPQDQKLIFNEKERDSKSFLDGAGVKNGSKILLIEDELSRERGYLVPRKNENMEKASKEIAAIRSEVDNLAKHVASIELKITGGSKVLDTDISNLIELLMTQVIKLDGVAAEGDVKLQRRMQVRRVQKYIETLDMLKIRNSGLGKVPLQKHNNILTGQMHITIENQLEQRKLGDFT